MADAEAARVTKATAGGERAGGGSSAKSERLETDSTMRGRSDERRHRRASSQSSSGSRSRSASRSRQDGRRGDSHRSARHHSSRHRGSHRHHHESSSRRRRSRSREHHSRRTHSRSRSLDAREHHREKSRRPSSRRDSRDDERGGSSSRRKHSDDRKRDGDRRHHASHRKRSRDEKEGDRADNGKRAKEAEADKLDVNAAESAVNSKSDAPQPSPAKETTDEVQKENAPPSQEPSAGEAGAAAVEQPKSAAEPASGTGNSGSTSPLAESSSQSSVQSAATASSVAASVDPFAVASSAKKLIEEAKKTLLKSKETKAAIAPAVDVSSIKMDILKALAEARSTIAEIKGSGESVVADDKASGEKPAGDASKTGGAQSQDKTATTTRRSASPSPTKSRIQSESASSTVAAVDEFDMFSMAELDDDAVVPGVSALNVSEVNMQSNCDDAEGYYNTTVGETLNSTYRVLGVVGKGVFSTVLRCARIAASKDGELDVVAIKLIRNNEVMRDAAQTEVKLLKELSERDPRDKKHCVRLLDTFEHRNHVALVFEPMQMNVREAMKKFGGKGGISIQAVRVFSKHLLIALNHLEACAIVHADIKPDNILLDDKQTTIKLCDFGSAFKMDEGKQDPTPYLVSRFYRAPEIVLGLAYDKSVDMWSIGCCLYEMFTGKVMFPGSTNNEMLKLFMELKGKIPNKLIKKHRQAYVEQFEMEPHFTEDLKFCSRESDRVTGKPILRLMDNVKTKNDLGSSLMAAKSSTDDRKLVLELRNLLERMFALDPAKRISAREALAHPFVKAP